MRARTTAVLTVLVTMLLGVVAVPASASTPVGGQPIISGGVNSHCTGSLLATEKIGTLSQGGGQQVGHIKVYYSSANNGTNCVQVFTDIGGPRHIRADLYIASSGNDTTAQIAAHFRDDGNYSHYAGGVYAMGTNGRCISWRGTVWNGGHPYYNQSWSWVFCG
mgnify:CR=1 FL=1